MVEEATISLRQYLEERLSEVEKRFDLHAKAHSREHNLEHEALLKAALDVTQRLEMMNEFRAQLIQERGLYLTRVLYEAQYGALITRMDLFNTGIEHRIGVLERTQYETQGHTLALSQGRERGHWTTTAAISFVGMVIIIVQFVLHFYK